MITAASACWNRLRRPHTAIIEQDRLVVAVVAHAGDQLGVSAEAGESVEPLVQGHSRPR